MLGQLTTSSSSASLASDIMQKYTAKELSMAKTRLRRNPDDSIQKIREGSSEDLFVLLDSRCALTALTRSQRSQYALALPFFLSSLKSKQSRTEENINLAGYIHFLEGVSLAAEMHDSLSEEAQNAYLLLVPNAVQTIFMLYDHLEVAANDDFGRQLKHIFRKIICDLCARMDITTLECVLTFTLRMWLEDEVHAADDSLALRSFALVLDALHNADRENRLLSSLEPFSHRRIARHTLDWLLSIIVRMSVFNSLASLTECCKVICVLSDYQQSANQLIAADAVGVLCMGLNKFRASSENEAIFGAFYNLLLCLRKLITLSLGRAKQALRSPLLGSILHTYLCVSSRTGDEKLLPFFSTETNGLLRPLLLYGSAVREMLEATNQLSSSDRLSLARDTVMGPVWTGLEELLLERAVAFRLFSFHRVEGTYKCCNPTCERKYRRKFLLRCAGCKEAAYCSKVCQREHWRNYGHEKECRDLRDFANVMGIRLIRDRSFVVFLAAIEVKRRISGLRELASAKFPRVPFDQIGFNVEFCRSPVAVDVFEICDEQNYDNDPTNYPRVVARALAHDDELSVLRITVDRGQRVSTLHAVARIYKRSGPTANDSPSLHRPSKDAFGNAPEVTPDIIDWLVRDISRKGEKPWCMSMIDDRIKDMYMNLEGL